MKYRIFLVFCMSIFLLTFELIAQEVAEKKSSASTKTFNIDDEQELYNSLKRVFFSTQHKNIVDTNWTSLHVSKRVTDGFIDMDVEVQNIVLSTKSFKDSNIKELKLEIYTTQNDKTTYYETDSFLHKLFWNRVEYILGLQKDWMECYSQIEAFSHYNHILCDANRPKEEVK
nr:hypothetical protein [uncultured Sulfurimonas sp.]